MQAASSPDVDRTNRLTYTSPDGGTAKTAWLDRVVTGWRQDLAYDVTGIRIKRSPIVLKEGPEGDAERAQQAAASAWTATEGMRHLRARTVLLARLTDNPGSTRSAAQARATLMSGLNVSGEEYDAALADETTSAHLTELERRQAEVKRFLKRRAKAKMPVFLVNGRYLVATSDVTRTFQVLNWMVAELSGSEG